jgi:AcrR family transcriptional regulator
VATIEAMVKTGLELTRTSVGEVDDPPAIWEAQVRAGIALFAGLVVAQPAAARLLLLESASAGPEALKLLEDASAGFERIAIESAAKDPDLAGLPPEIITAATGAVQEVARNRLRSGTEDDLPGLVDELVAVIESYRPPPEPLQVTTRPPAFAPESIDAAYDRSERALRAFAAVVAEEGYLKTTIAQVTKRASISPTTFYANFSDKEDAFMAAIDSSGAQIVAAVLPVFRRNPDWTHGVRAAVGALFNFLASRPSIAQLLLCEVYAAGPKAVERRDRSLQPLAALLTEGVALSPEIPAITTEVIGGGISRLAYRQIKDGGASSLPGLAAICTYYALAPFIGAEAACEVANGDGRGREESSSTTPYRRSSTAILMALQTRARSFEELASEVNVSPAEVEATVEQLQLVGLITTAVPESIGDSGATTFYAPTFHWFDEEEWQQLDLADRRRASALITDLIAAEIDRAVTVGTFDSRSDRHLTRMRFKVDEQGWRDLFEVHLDAFKRSIEIRDESARRLEQSGEVGFEAISVQASFEASQT